jgi:transcriptional regulator with XRE-family HTH domain
MIDDDFLRLQMGDKLRRIREDRGRGVDEVAAAAGIDGERLRAFEENREVPAVADLLRISECLNVSIGHFFQMSIPAKRVELVRANERFTVRPSNEAALTLSYRYQALSHGLTDKLMSPFLVEIPPNNSAPPTASSHEGEEFIFLLSGQLDVDVGGEVYRLQPGDAMYYDSRLEHTLRAAEGGPARLLACVAQPPRARSQSYPARKND